MVLSFEVLKLFNFKTYHNSMFSFTPGHNVIIGENGAGKSSVFEAITYALFGIVPGKKVSSLIRHDQKKMGVQLEFSIDGEELCVERIITPSSSSALLMAKNGRRIAEKSKAVNEEIENRLGFGQQVFSNVIYIPQGQIASIALEQPAGRRELFDKILGYYLYQKTRERLRIIEKSSAQFRNSVIKRIGDFESDIKQMNRLKTELEELNNALAVLKKELAELEPNLENKIDFFNKMNQERERINQIKERVETQEREIINRQNELSSTIESLKSELGKQIPNKKEEILKIKVEMEIKLKKFENMIHQTEIMVEEGKKVENTLFELNRTKDDIENQIEKLQQKINQLTYQIDLDIKIEDLEKEIRRFYEIKRNLENSLKVEIDNDKHRSILLENKKLFQSEDVKIEDRVKNCEALIADILPEWKTRLNLLLEKNIKQELCTLNNEIKKNQERLTEIQSSIKSLISQKRSEKEILNAIIVSKKKICPLCGQKMEDSHIFKIKTEKENFILCKTNEIKKLKDDKEKLVRKIALLEENRRNLGEEEKQQIKLEKLLNDLNLFKFQHSDNIKSLNKIRTQLKTFKDTQERILKIEEEIKINEKKILEANEKTRIYENVILLQDQLKDLKKKLDATASEINIKYKDFHYIELERNVGVLNKQKNDQKTLLRTIPRFYTIITVGKALEKAIELKNKNLKTLESMKTDFNELDFEKLKINVENLKTKKIKRN